MKFSRYLYLGISNRIRKLLGRNTTPGVTIATTAHIAPSAVIQIRGGGSIRIGENSEIMDGAMILTHGGNIEIGDNCSVNVYSVLYGSESKQRFPGFALTIFPTIILWILAVIGVVQAWMASGAV